MVSSWVSISGVMLTESQFAEREISKQELQKGRTAKNVTQPVAASKTECIGQSPEQIPCRVPPCGAEACNMSRALPWSRTLPSSVFVNKEKVHRVNSAR